MTMAKSELHEKRKITRSEADGANLKNFNFQLFMNLKNKYLLGLKCLHNSIFIIIISDHNIIPTFFITIIISQYDSIMSNRSWLNKIKRILLLSSHSYWSYPTHFYYFG